METFLACVYVFTRVKEEEQAWDPNTQRNRRKVVFAEKEEGSDVSGSSDEDEDDESDDGDQEEDEDEDNLSTFLKEARAKSDTSKKNVREPPQVKKQKLEERKEEIPVFADSEDELEMSEEEGEAGRPGDSGNCSEESDDDEEAEDDNDENSEDEVEAADATVKKQSASEEEEEEEQGKYTVLGFISLQINFCSICIKRLHLYDSSLLMLILKLGYVLY